MLAGVSPGCDCGGPFIPDPPAECDADGKGCLPDETCVEGTCVLLDRCESDADCPSAAYLCTFPAQLCELRPGFDLECETSTDCEPGNYCALGRCRDLASARTCARRGDCPLGQGCDRLHFVCIEEAPCTLAEDYPELACDPGETCELGSGRCALPCQNQCTVATQAEDCGAGLFCDGSCRCVQCLSNAQCGAGLVCNTRAGRCEPENLCYSDDDCEEPLICDPRTALCQVPPPPCETDRDCAIAEVCNRITGACELPGGVCIDDRFEDADTPAVAEEVALELDGSPLILDELQLCPDDDDVYAVALETGESLTATVSGTTPLARATLWLLDSTGAVSVDYAEAPPYGSGTVTHVAQADETVFLRLNALLGQTPYALEMTRTTNAPCATDLFEGATGNNTTDTATPAESFPLGTSLAATICPSDVDNYLVNLAAGEGLEVSLRADRPDADLDLFVVDVDDGEVLAESAGVSGNEATRLRVSRNRTVAVVVDGFALEWSPYQIEVTRLPAFICEPDDGEPDDALESAHVVDVESQIAGAERTLCVGDRDQYLVSLNDFERLVARAAFEPADLDLRLEVWDATGTTRLAESPNSGKIESVTYAAAGNETVLLRVVGVGNTQGPYTLDVKRENQVDCSPDSFEPNDDTVDAATLPDATVELSLCGSDEDLFVVEGAMGKRLEATIAFLHADGDLDLMVLGSNGQQIVAVSDGTGNSETIDYVLPTNGPFYLRVFSLQSTPAARYTLSATVSQ